MMSERSSKRWASIVSKSFSRNTTDEPNPCTGGVDGHAVRRHRGGVGERDAGAAQAHGLPGNRRCGDVAVSAGAVRGLDQDAAEAQARFRNLTTWLRALRPTCTLPWSVRDRRIRDREAW